jgi:sugar lactone lactonase YvrE
MSVVIALAITAALVWGVAIATGAPGDLTYQGCQSADTGTGPAGTNACSPIGTPTSGGFNSGLDNIRGTAVSPDGTSVYTTAAGDSAVAVFRSETPTGPLTYQGCITGETATTACTQIASATANGDNSGLGSTQGIAVSPDGTSVYVTASFDAAVARFDRDPGTGALTYQGCISGETQSASCTQLPHASPGGVDSGLSDPQSITATNGSLYVASREDDAVARLSRTPGTGAIAWQDCISGETESGPSGGGGSNACSLVPSATSTGQSSGLDLLQTVALSPGGSSLYTASQGDSAIARFDRDTSSGALIYQGCITGELESGPALPPPGSGACAEIPSATSFGANSGMLSQYAVTVSGDGHSVYSTAENDDALDWFERAPGGALTYQGCISGKTTVAGCAQIPSAQAATGDNSGLRKLRTAAVAPSGGSVYMTASMDDTVARFSRDPGTGGIAYVGCITGETQTGPTGTNACPQIPSATAGGTNSGVDNPQSIAISPDGATLYYGAANDAGVARFAIEPEPLGEAGDTTPPDTQITDKPKKKTKKKKATFAFTSTEPGSSFQCKLDKGGFAPCGSPDKFKVKKRKHHFEVRATDAAGNTDPSPATFDWKVKKKKKKRHHHG